MRISDSDEPISLAETLDATHRAKASHLALRKSMCYPNTELEPAPRKEQRALEHLQPKGVDAAGPITEPPRFRATPTSLMRVWV
jgi:hypothetical protein